MARKSKSMRQPATPEEQIFGFLESWKTKLSDIMAAHSALLAKLAELPPEMAEQIRKLLLRDAAKTVNTAPPALREESAAPAARSKRVKRSHRVPTATGDLVGKRAAECAEVILADGAKKPKVIAIIAVNRGYRSGRKVSGDVDELVRRTKHAILAAMHKHPDKFEMVEDSWRLKPAAAPATPLPPPATAGSLGGLI